MTKLRFQKPKSTKLSSFLLVNKNEKKQPNQFCLFIEIDIPLLFKPPQKKKKKKEKMEKKKIRVKVSVTLKDFWRGRVEEMLVLRRGRNITNDEKDNVVIITNTFIRRPFLC